MAREAGLTRRLQAAVPRVTGDQARLVGRLRAAVGGEHRVDVAAHVVPGVLSTVATNTPPSRSTRPPRPPPHGGAVTAQQVQQPDGADGVDEAVRRAVAVRPRARRPRSAAGSAAPCRTRRPRRTPGAPGAPGRSAGWVTRPLAGSPLSWRHLLGRHPRSTAASAAVGGHTRAAYAEGVRHGDSYANWLAAHPRFGPAP